MKRSLRALLAVPAAALALAPLALSQDSPQERAHVEDLLARMTLEEKLALVHADSKFTTAAIPRLGIARRWLSDGPHGVREDVGPDTWKAAGRTDDFVSWMPAIIGLAASWNPDLARQYGEVIGQEARQRGKDIMLGPGMNLMRTPLGGRNFEYPGEDPYLAAQTVVPYILGVQNQGVASCAKHFVGNEQEWERFTVDVQMDERTLRELYLVPFRAAVREANVFTVMGAYNKFRGTHACHNDYLLNRILKDEWGFQGLVMSDWNGTHDTKEAVLNGLDLEMGTEKPYNEFYLADPFRDGLKSGAFPMAALDDKARRNLRVILKTKALQEDPRRVPSMNTPEHQAVARAVAEESMVLLKNDGAALPLDPEKVASIAVIGENAVKLQAHAGGSSRIKAFYEVTPLEGILRRVGPRATVSFSMGYQENAAPDLAEKAVKAAAQADVVIFVAGVGHGKFFDEEGQDRKDMALPWGQDALIERVVAANPRTIVVLVSGAPVDMPWVDKVPAVLEAWYAGMEGGHALARILFGDVSPSGKLPCTFPKRLADSPAHALGAYPSKDGVMSYAEGLLMGYRWFDAKGIAPLFPFGHGLSYSTFKYSDLKVVDHPLKAGVLVTVEFNLTNTGSREAAEVAQVYVADVESSLPRPPKELAGLQKVRLKPGETQAVVVRLQERAFAFYDPARQSFVAEKGAFKILVGSSSRDVRLTGAFTLGSTTRAY